MKRSEAVLEFWFGGASDPAAVIAERQPVWFGGGEAFDAACQTRLGDDVQRALAGELAGWRDAPRACLAYILLLDQLTRNIGRGTPRAFAGDPQALAAAKHAVDAGLDQQLEFHHRLFMYLPFEHSEDRADQARSVALFEALVPASGPLLEPAKTYLRYAQTHFDIVARFGRFPHRNRILGRASTDEEIEFLKQPGSSF